MITDLQISCFMELPATLRQLLKDAVENELIDAHDRNNEPNPMLLAFWERIHANKRRQRQADDFYQVENDEWIVDGMGSRFARVSEAMPAFIHYIVIALNDRHRTENQRTKRKHR